MKTIVAKNGYEYTIPDINDNLDLFQTGHTVVDRSNGEAFSFVPGKVGVVYNFGPFKSWLYKKDEHRPNLICVDYNGKTIYMPRDVFLLSSCRHRSCQTAFVFSSFDIIVHKSPYFSTKPTKKDSYTHGELEELGFVNINTSEISESSKYTIGYPGGLNSGAITTLKADYAYKNVKTRLENENVINDSFYIDQRFFLKEIIISDSFKTVIGVDTGKFIEEFFYHSVYMCALWIKEKNKIKRNIVKNKASELGMSVREFQKSLKDKELSIKSVEKTSEILKVAPKFISAKEHLELFTNKLSNGEPYTVKEVYQLRKLLKSLDKGLLDIRYLGKY